LEITGTLPSAGRNASGGSSGDQRKENVRKERKKLQTSREGRVDTGMVSETVTPPIEGDTSSPAVGKELRGRPTLIRKGKMPGMVA